MKEREDRYIARAKKGTPAGDLATERWRETMQERYGNVTEKMQELGSRGGKAPTTKPKGFAANPQLARTAGALGGRISRRTKKVVSN